MRSPFPTPGRNTAIERIWQAIFNFNRTPAPGQVRPVSRTQYWAWDEDSLYSRNYDLELEEPIVRGGDRARQVVEMAEYSPEIAAAVSVRQKAFWGNVAGDDLGFALNDALPDGSAVDPQVYQILQRLFDEVVGGVALKPVSETMQSFGDAFISIGINFKKNQIDRLSFLPTFEMFRIEDRFGQLLGYQQRRNISDETDAIAFHPLTVAHVRYRRRVGKLYGRSLFAECWPDYLALKESDDDLRGASRSIGLNPNVHTMPSCTNEDYFDAYKEAHQRERQRRAITDYYFMNGGNVGKVASSNPDLKALLDGINFRRCRIAMKCEVPLWLLGLSWPGAQDIAQQPSMAFVRSINSDRGDFTGEIVRHLCNLELALHGIEKSRWQYRITFPKIYVSPYEEQQDPIAADETNLKNIEDLDARRNVDYLALSSEIKISKELEEVRNGKSDALPS